jgi:hypothetical protein
VSHSAVANLPRPFISFHLERHLQLNPVSGYTTHPLIATNRYESLDNHLYDDDDQTQMI